MTILKAAWICPYLTAGGTWRQADYNASMMVKALKGKPFNGYFDAKVGGVARRFTNDNASDFLPTIHQFMAKMILDRIEDDATLIPIPNSPVTSVTHLEFKTKALAEGIAAQSGGRLRSNPILVFREAQPSSSSGDGSRNPNHFAEAYELTENPTGQIVFIDDVLTTGAHLVGACWRLEGT